jgi:hypothetical protein
MSANSTISVFKENITIRGLDIHVSFYERLMSVLQYFAAPDQLVALKKESPQEYQYHVETLLILFQTMDELALAQQLVEQGDPEAILKNHPWAAGPTL